MVLQLSKPKTRVTTTPRQRRVSQPFRTFIKVIVIVVGTRKGLDPCTPGPERPSAEHRQGYRCTSVFRYPVPRTCPYQEMSDHAAYSWRDAPNKIRVYPEPSVPNPSRPRKTEREICANLTGGPLYYGTSCHVQGSRSSVELVACTGRKPWTCKLEQAGLAGR